jgi:RNA polymerase sigma-70 factor (ECF subfamily)
VEARSDAALTGGWASNHAHEPDQRAASARGKTTREVEDASRLMERVGEGDVAAFEALYDAYHRLVYGIALKVLATEAAAEDVTQAVFVKVWTSAPSFRSGNFVGWIARVARNRAIDALRSGSRNTELAHDIPADVAMDDAIVVRVDAARARTMIQALPHEQRTAIELAFFGGLTHRQIAAQTTLPLGTVKTRIRAGLRAVRDAMTQGAST